MALQTTTSRPYHQVDLFEALDRLAEIERALTILRVGIKALAKHRNNPSTEFWDALDSWRHVQQLVKLGAISASEGRRLDHYFGRVSHHAKWKQRALHGQS